MSSKKEISEPGIPYTEIINGIKWQFIDLGKMEPCVLCELNFDNLIHEQTKKQDKRKI